MYSGSHIGMVFRKRSTLGIWGGSVHHAVSGQGPARCVSLAREVRLGENCWKHLSEYLGKVNNDRSSELHLNVLLLGVMGKIWKRKKDDAKGFELGKGLLALCLFNLNMQILDEACKCGKVCKLTGYLVLRFLAKNSGWRMHLRILDGTWKCRFAQAFENKFFW